jgi:5,10-methylenetetrahydromethanopterin reductase
VRFGIAFQTDKRPADYEALADVVDRYTFDVVSVYNDLFFQPALGPLLLMAPRIRRAALGPAALNPYTVHPIEIAGQIALLDLVSDGRAYLGLVRGAWLRSIGVVQRQPLVTLREAVIVIRRLLARKTDGFIGRVFRLDPDEALHFEPKRAEVPITIGTWGSATARLAGELADEVKVGGSTNPIVAQHLLSAIAAGLSHAARPASAVPLCLGAVTVVDADRQVARAHARRMVARYLPVVAPLDPTVRDDAAPWLVRIRAAGERGDFDAIAGDIPDHLLDRFAFAGTPTDVVGQVARLVDAGVDRVEFGAPHGVGQVEGIELLGEHVLPCFTT